MTWCVEKTAAPVCYVELNTHASLAREDLLLSFHLFQQKQSQTVI